MERIFLLIIISIFNFHGNWDTSSTVTNNLAVKPLLLKYHFKNYYPINFKITKTGTVYVGDGHLLYEFDKNGDFKRQIVVPGTSYQGLIFSDFLIDESNQNICYVDIGQQITGVDINTGKKMMNVEGFGDEIRTDNLGNFYNLYQVLDKADNQVKNKLRVIKGNGNSFDYKINRDLHAENLELVNSKIVLYNWDVQTIFLLPLASNSSEPIEQHKLDLPVGIPVRFLGEVQHQYIFQYTDYKKKVDVLAFYDRSFSHLLEKELKFGIKDIASRFKKQNTCDCMMQFPAGNIYSFCNGEIFLMRNANNGTFICNVTSLVKI